MRFRTRLPNDTATLLLLSVFVMVLVGVSFLHHDPASRHVTAISAIAAIVILVVYAVWVTGYIRGGLAEEAGEGAEAARVPLPVAGVLLGVAGVGSAFVSEWFVSALSPTIDKLNLSPAFAGLVIVAIAGNAVENATGIVLAAKGKADLAISVVKNSVAQIAAFLFPALVLTSLLFHSHLTFQLSPVYIAALFLTAIAVWQVTTDGHATAFEGWALVGTFVILATVAYYE